MTIRYLFLLKAETHAECDRDWAKAVESCVRGVGAEIGSAVIFGAQKIGSFGNIFKTLVLEGQTQVREEHIPIKTADAIVVEMAA